MSCSVLNGVGSGLRATDGCSGMGWTSVSGWRAIVLCITCLSWVLFLSPLLSPFSSLLLLLLLLLLILLLLLLNCSYLSLQVFPFILFMILLPISCGDVLLARIKS